MAITWTSQTRISQKNKFVVGIDLGTTNSVIAIAGLGGGDQIVTSDTQFSQSSGSPIHRIPVQILQIEQEGLDGTLVESSLLPSSVYVDQDGRIFVGRGAREAEFHARRGHRVFYSVKRDLGKDLIRAYPAAVTSDFDNPVKVSAKILRELKTGAEKRLKVSLDGVPTVITVPASFQSAQRRDTLAAAALAGFKIEDNSLLDEPNAALLAHINRVHTRSRLSREETILVFDFGGGTCDVSIIDASVSPNQQAITLKNRSISRYEELGGDDIDRHIAYTVLSPRFYKEINIDENIFSPAELRNKIWPSLTRIAAELKHRMCEEIDRDVHNHGTWDDSRLSAISVTLPPETVETPRGTFVLRSLGLSYTEFCTIMDPYVADFGARNHKDRDRGYTVGSVLDPVKTALERAELSQNEITRVLLVGGSSRNPLIERAIGNYCRFAIVDRAPDLDHLVAEGAAVHAYCREILGQEVLAPIIADGIGILVDDGRYHELLPPGTSVPYPTEGEWHTITNLSVPKNKPKSMNITVCVGSFDCQAEKGVWELPANIKPLTPLVARVRIDSNKVFLFDIRLSQSDQESFQIQIENPLATVQQSAEEHAVDRAERSARHSPTASTMLSLANALQQAGRYQRAIEVLDSARRLGANAKDVDQGRAYNLFHLGRQSGAHQLFVELANDNPWYAYMAGLTAPDLHDKLRFMRIAVSKRPNDYVSHYGLGLALKEASATSEAKSSFARALELGEMRLASHPDDDQAWRFKALILHELGRWAEATELQRRRATMTAKSSQDDASYPSTSPSRNHDT